MRAHVPHPLQYNVIKTWTENAWDRIREFWKNLEEETDARP